LAAIRCASSRLSSLGAERRPFHSRGLKKPAVAWRASVKPMQNCHLDNKSA
jgi:hypothetical protein